MVISLTEITTLRRLQNVMDALGEHIAVLDASGQIVLVNSAWKSFAASQGNPGLAQADVGTNYMSIVQAARSSDPTAEQAYQGLKSLLDGTSDRFTLEYPCAGPDQERWFVMNATRVQAPNPGVVVSHVDITEWRQKVGAASKSGA